LDYIYHDGPLGFEKSITSSSRRVGSQERLGEINLVDEKDIRPVFINKLLQGKEKMEIMTGSSSS